MQARRTSSFLAAARAAAEMLLETSSDEEQPKKPFRERKKYKRPDYWDSPWGRMIKSGEWRDKNTRMSRKFRRKFRLTPPLIDQLIEDLKTLGFSDDEFSFGRRCAPLILKVLGVLRVIGRAWTFDDVEEFTYISEETIRVFFHNMAHAVGVRLWDKYVHFPKTEEDLARCEATFSPVGFPGCVFSTDCVHVPWGCCPYALKVSHTGKEKRPTLSYSVRDLSDCAVTNSSDRARARTTGRSCTWVPVSLVRRMTRRLRAQIK